MVLILKEHSKQPHVHFKDGTSLNQDGNACT